MDNMYKFYREKQLTLEDFDQPLGLKMEPSNRWVIKSEMIPWETTENDYAKFFPSKTGMPAKKIRKLKGKQLQYVCRNFGYLNDFLEKDEVEISDKETAMLDVVKTVYGQQLYMYENKTHSVENRIISISQPYIRPIVRGKAKAPVEFGAKLDLPVDENGMAQIENLSFDAYNEAEVLKIAVENYKERTGYSGHYYISKTMEFFIEKFQLKKTVVIEYTLIKKSVLLLIFFIINITGFKLKNIL